MGKQVAVFIDGDNISATFAKRTLDHADSKGLRRVTRAYANAQQTSGWSSTPGVRLIHAGTGKNASDVLLSIDAVEIALTTDIDTFLIATSDGDFSHLAYKLREYGRCVLGLGEAKAPCSFRAACTEFVPLNFVAICPTPKPLASPPPQFVEFDQKIRAVIAEHSQGAQGLRLADLGAKMDQVHGVQIKTYPEGSWRGYLSKRPELFSLDPKGPDAKVRFLPAGFLAAR